MTLLHFIALTVKEKYPDLATFWHELHFVEKAAAGEGSSLGQCQEAEQEEHLGSFLAFVILLLQSFLLKP